MNKSTHVRYSLLALAGVAAACAVELFGPDGALGHKTWSAPALAVAIWAVHWVASKREATPPAALLLVLCIPLLGGATCIKTPVGPTPPADAGLVNCLEADVHDQVLKILADVTSDLGQATSVSAAALESLGLTLAAQIGAPLAIDAIGCAVQAILLKAQQQVATTSDSLAALQVANAKAWLAKHPQFVSAQ